MIKLTIPGRMALLVTLFLVLVNIFNSVTGNAPKAEGLTAVETWVLFILNVIIIVITIFILIILAPSHVVHPLHSHHHAG